MVKDVQTAGNIKFQSRRHTRSFRLRLPQKFVVQIAQNWHFRRIGVCKERAVHVAYGSINDGLFHGREALLAADHQLTQREQKIRFQRKGAVVLTVIEVNIHGIDVVGAGRGNADHLSVKPLHQRRVLGFRVADDNIVVRNEKGVCHFTLCGKALAAARCTEDQAVGVFKLLAVAQDHVVGKGV